MAQMTEIELHKSLFDGVCEDDMTHLPDISTYNHNYYVFNGRLLFGKSDDDNFTAWYWVKGDRVRPIGGSYCSDGDKIIVDAAYT
jgi:hypothetical protein